jgi:hypothetical protein
VPAHTKGCEGNHPAETQIQSLRVSCPLDGAPKSANCWPPHVSLCRPLINRGACLGYNFHILCCRSWRNVRGVGESCKLGLPSPLLRHVRSQPLYLHGCDTVGSLKLVVTLVHPHILLHNPPFPPYLLPLCLKKNEGQKEGK